MVQVDVGDQCQVGVDQVDCIQVFVKVDFQYCEVQFGVFEQLEGGQCVYFEIGQGNFVMCGFYCGEGVVQLCIVGFDVVDLYLFVVVQQVW